MTKKAITLLVSATTIVAGILLWKARKPQVTRWIDNPSYDKLGSVSEEWLCNQKRKS